MLVTSQILNSRRKKKHFFSSTFWIYYWSYDVDSIAGVILKRCSFNISKGQLNFRAFVVFYMFFHFGKMFRRNFYKHMKITWFGYFMRNSQRKKTDFYNVNNWFDMENQWPFKETSYTFNPKWLLTKQLRNFKYKTMKLA